MFTELFCCSDLNLMSHDILFRCLIDKWDNFYWDDQVISRQNHLRNRPVGFHAPYSSLFFSFYMLQYHHGCTKFLKNWPDLRSLNAAQSQLVWIDKRHQHSLFRTGDFLSSSSNSGGPEVEAKFGRSRKMLTTGGGPSQLFRRPFDQSRGSPGQWQLRESPKKRTSNPDLPLA